MILVAIFFIIIIAIIISLIFVIDKVEQRADELQLSLDGINNRLDKLEQRS
jgi:uncharacterized protein YoxC